MSRQNDSRVVRPSNWGPEELWYVQEISTTNSLAKAASNLGVANSTLAKRVSNLEHRLGFRLFDRSPKGAFLTATGRRIMPQVQAALNALEDLEMRSIAHELQEAVQVRLSTTDGIATHWLSRNIGKLHQSQPQITLHCHIADHPADPLLAETDLSIRHRPPENDEFVARNLGSLHYYPYASKSYLDAYGDPDIDNMHNHKVVEHTSYQFMTGPWYSWESSRRLSGPVSLRTNIGAMTVTAIKSGAGIGLLPTYVSLFSDDLVPLDLGVHMRSDIWLCYLRGSSNQEANRTVSYWLQNTFDQKRYPCFQNEFVHPSDILEDHGIDSADFSMVVVE